MLVKSLLAVLAITVLLGCGFFIYRLDQANKLLKNDKASLEKELEVQKANINALIQEIATTSAARDELARKYSEEKSRTDAVELQVNAVKDTVSVIEKVKAVDPELLKKYSKIYFLNENYSPKKLSPIDAKYIYSTKKELLFHDRILPNLQKLMDDAYAAGVDIKIISAYRSFGEQTVLKTYYTMIYGSGANKFSADQGYSEHQLGTAVDFTTEAANGALTVSAFEKSKAYEWLINNAHKYGFILSYSHNNSYYQFEPWHWRFIGREFATRLHDEGKVFYDMDQRVIDTYLISFFD